MNYQKQANDFCERTGTKITVGEPTYKKHFADDTTPRYVFPITIIRKGKRMSVKFGQSLANGSEEPTAYDVLSCIQKYDVGTFDNFCWNYGVEPTLANEALYKRVAKEYEGVSRVFGDVLGELREIE